MQYFQINRALFQKANKKGIFISKPIGKGGYEDELKTASSDPKRMLSWSTFRPTPHEVNLELVFDYFSNLLLHDYFFSPNVT